MVEPGDLADECIGLPAGFLDAGAPTVIGSLWAVDDLSTALLMEEFYREILNGVPPAQALRTAQRWLCKTVSRRFVEDRIQVLLAGLETKQAQLPRWSEAGESVARQIKRFKRQLEDLRQAEKSDPAGRPFAHPYYWAAFTVSGLA